MSENLKTIKELADELGVSKQNLQYHVKFLPTKKRQKNESGIVVLNIEEQMFISGRIKKNKAKDINDETKKGQKNINEETKKRQKNNDVFAFNNHLLKEIIDLKEVNKQLLESQKQTQNLLDQQQRLALQDKKLLEEYKAENDRLLYEAYFLLVRWVQAHKWNFLYNSKREKDCIHIKRCISFRFVQ